jgi:biotin-dependent carboxylase-like uncharacterized protein
MTRLRIVRAAPLTTLQDDGRFGMLRYGVSASGPMDRGAFAHAAHLVEGAGPTGVEFTMAGLEIEVTSGSCRVGFAGGLSRAHCNGEDLPWPGAAELKPGDRLAVQPGPAGNYAYLRFDKAINVPPVMGSRATNIRIGLGGFHDRALQSSDMLALGEAEVLDFGKEPVAATEQPIRIVWGLHAQGLPALARASFLEGTFIVTSQMDRMGVRLDDADGAFTNVAGLSLVSDAIVPGDIQILGDGTPVVLMRDHQPTGGYPRIATIISADLDRFAQMRPGTRVRFESVSLAHAQSLRTKTSGGAA